MMRLIPSRLTNIDKVSQIYKGQSKRNISLNNKLHEIATNYSSETPQKTVKKMNGHDSNPEAIDIQI